MFKKVEKAKSFPLCQLYICHNLLLYFEFFVTFSNVTENYRACDRTIRNDKNKLLSITKEEHLSNTLNNQQSSRFLATFVGVFAR